MTLTADVRRRLRRTYARRHAGRARLSHPSPGNQPDTVAYLGKDGRIHFREGTVMRTMHLSILTATTLALVLGSAAPAWSRSATPEASAQYGFAGAASRPAGRYRTVDLGTLGGAQSSARAINDRGDIAGDSET